MKHLVLIAWMLAGCGAPPGDCTPGETRSCVCDAVGRFGTETCSVTGHGFDGCDCPLSGACPTRECGADPSTGAACGTCSAGYRCTSLGRCTAD